VPASVQTRVSKGLAVSIYGLNGLLPTGQVRGIQRDTPAERVDRLLRTHLGQELRVDVLRLDPDAGHIFVSERRPAGHQLPLPLDMHV
jgi:ribosomal protein S1